MTASNQIIKMPESETRAQFMPMPKTFEEIERYCTYIANSSFCPPAYKGKAGDVMVAIQMGSEVGLSPMQALQNIAVINGRPCIWGDAALAVVMGSPNYQWHKETFLFDDKGIMCGAICTMKRKGSEEHSYTFTVDDAKKAGLWTKSGVWSSYPSRMLQMRARGFAMRDKFADALRGISVREEVEDYEIKDVTPQKPRSMAPTFNVKQAEEHLNDISELEMEFAEKLNDIKTAPDLSTLEAVVKSIKKKDYSVKPELLKKLIDAKDTRKEELTLSSVINAEEIDPKREEEVE